MVEKTDFSATLMVLLITAVCACLFFASMAKFNLYANAATLFYSTIYAAAVIISMITSMKILQYASISAVTVISSSGSLITSTLVGVIFFGENLFKDNTLLRIILMLVAVFLVYMDRSRLSQQNTASLKRNTLIFTLLIIMSVINLSAVNLINKYYTMSEKVVSDNNVYYFYTNVIMFFCVLAMLVFRCIKHPEAFKPAVATLKIKYLMVVVGNTVISDAHALLALPLIKATTVIWYSSVTNALSIILGTIASLLFREKLSIFAYIAMFLCVFVVFI
jgi:hypothetical protein